MTAPWVVLLEMARPFPSAAVEPEQIWQLVIELAGEEPAALAAPDRYALQLRVLAADPASAITAAQLRLADTTARLDIPAWELVRAEAVTQADYERECDMALARHGVKGRTAAELPPWCWWPGHLSSQQGRPRSAGRCGRRGP